MSRRITIEQVEKNNTAKSLWMVIHDNVYNVSAFLKEHPGGPDILLEFAGKDATDEFDNVGHSADAKEMLKDFQIGVLSDVADPEPECCKKCHIVMGVGGLCFVVGCAFLVKRYLL